MAMLSKQEVINAIKSAESFGSHQQNLAVMKMILEILVDIRDELADIRTGMTYLRPR